MNLAIINARMESKRFPGKLMQELVPGKSVLEVFLERMKLVKSWDGMVLAMQLDKANDPLREVAEKMKVPVWESQLQKLENGAEDVLGRTLEAADHYHANTIIRVTPDNPCLHASVIHRVCVNYYMNRNGAHYVSNCWHRGVGNGFPRGTEVEVFSYAALGQSENETRPGKVYPTPEEQTIHSKNNLYDREHVTTFIRRFSRLFGHADIPPGQGMSGSTATGLMKLDEAIPVRLTLDYPEDLEVLRGVFGELYGKEPMDKNDTVFSLTDIAALHKSKPELFKANENIEQWG